MHKKAPAASSVACANRFLLSANTWATTATTWREAKLSQKAKGVRKNALTTCVKPFKVTARFLQVLKLRHAALISQAPRWRSRPYAARAPLRARRGSPTPISPIASVQTRPAPSWPSTSSQRSRRPCRTAAPSSRPRSRRPRTAGGRRCAVPATKSSGEAAAATPHLPHFTGVFAPVLLD